MVGRRTQTGDDGGDDGDHEHSLGPSHDLGHGDLVFVWAAAGVQPRVRTDQATTALGGDGYDDTLYSTKVESF